MAAPRAHPVRAALVVSDPHARHVIAGELAGDLRIDLAAQATSLREGRRQVRTVLLNVLLVDLQLADGSGLELVAELKARQPGADAIVMAAADSEEDALRAFDLGAAGWLVRTAWYGSFAQSVLQVAGGGAAITPALARRLLRRSEASAAALAPARPAAAALPVQQLSERETEVLTMVAQGLRSREIGQRLCISGETVNAHVKSIYRKLQVRSRAQAVRIATQTGIV